MVVIKMCLWLFDIADKVLRISTSKKFKIAIIPINVEETEKKYRYIFFNSPPAITVINASI